MKSLILAFDIGTSSCKAAVYSEEGKILFLKKSAYSLSVLENGWVEQNPQEILEGLFNAVQKIKTGGCDLSSVGAISFSSQIASQFLVDGDGKPLTMMMSWMDKRAEKEVEEYNRRFTGEEAARLTGMDMVMTPAHTTTKLKWMQKNIPHLVAKARYVVQIKEWVIHYLTGEWVSDATSLKGIVDQQSGKPIPEIMDFIEAGENLVPPVKKPYEIAGTLKKGVCGFEDICEGTPVIVGWNDMNAAFLGTAGLSQDRAGVDLTGTSEHFGVIMRNYNGEKAINGVNLVPFVEHARICYGVTSSGGQAFDWYVRNVMSNGRALDETYAHVIAKAQTVAPEENAELICLPFVSGERNPWNNPNARCAFIGLGKKHTDAHMTLALLEGVAFTLRAIKERFPQQPRRFSVSGGASRIGLLNQIKADVMGTRFEKLSTTEAGCNGAAILARIALSPHVTMAQAAADMYATDEYYDPREKYARLYDDKYARFIKLYQALYADDN